MFKPICSTLSILAALCFSLSAFAGAGSSGGGADSENPTQGVAWFVGQAGPIKACIKVAPDFGMPRDVDSQAMIQTVFKTWQIYVRDKLVEKKRSDQLKLIFDLNFLPSCDGTQELAFYFGVNNDETVKPKADYNDPLGFVYRQSFDETKGRGKGFVWIQGDSSQSLWRNPARLQALLMHEVGHILGCDHVSGTIMDSQIADFIRSDASNAFVVGDNAQKIKSADQARIEYFSKNIDGNTLLYWCMECQTPVPGEIGTPKRWEPATGFDPKITFTRFVGRAPIGKIEATFQMELNVNDDKHPFKALSLVYRDQLGSKVIPFLMRQGVNAFDQSNHAFIFNVYTTSDPHGGTASLPALAAVLEGYVHDAAGKLLPITIALNSSTNYSWVQINYAKGLVDLPLFRATAGSDWYDRRD